MSVQLASAGGGELLASLTAEWSAETFLESLAWRGLEEARLTVEETGSVKLLGAFEILSERDEAA